jgi:paraquat-inducible protein A
MNCCPPSLARTVPQAEGRLRECDDCGRLVRMPPVAAGIDSRCPRCDAVLRRHRQSPLLAPLALNITSLILCLVTVCLPFLSLRLLGQERDSYVGSGAWAFEQDGLWLLSVVVLATLVLVPLARMGLRLAVLSGLLLRRPPRYLAFLLRWHEHLGAWAMLEVFLFGALVSYTRLVDLAQVELGPAVYGLGALVLAMVAADAAFEPQAVWDALEERGVMARPARAGATATAVLPQPATSPAAPPPPGAMLISCHCCRRVDTARPGEACPRCGATLHRRKPNSVARCWALVVASAILYLPANYYPVMSIVTLGQGGPHTIMGGVVEFVQTGFWPLALIVFLASVAVPMLKLLGLAYMLIGIQRRSRRNLLPRTRLYRVVEALGRWSMIDVFVVSVLIALVRFGNLAQITAGIGAACFGAVVILTIIAAESFDPRLMWDAAEAPAARTAPSAAPSKGPRA